MPAVQSQVTIHATASRVFEALAEPVHFTAWMTGLEHAHRRTRGPARIGSITDLAMRLAGLELEIVAEVTALEPGHHLAVRFSGPLLTGEARYRLTARAGGRTEVRSRLDLAFAGLLAPLSGLALPIAAGKAKTDLHQLRAYLEGGGSRPGSRRA